MILGVLLLSGDDPAHLHRPLRLGLRAHRPGRLGLESSGALRPRRSDGAATEASTGVGNVQARSTVEREQPKPCPSVVHRSSRPRRRRASSRGRGDGEPLNVAGEDPAAADFSDSETVAGRDPRHGREIALAGELGRRQRARGRRPGPAGDSVGRQAAAGRGPVPVHDRARLRRRRASRRCRSAPARGLMDKPHGCDEVDLVGRGRRGHDRVGAASGSSTSSARASRSRPRTARPTTSSSSFRPST